MTAILGLDVGERRVGVAIAEAGGLAARPLTTLQRHRSIAADASDLLALIERHGVGELVVGLPYEAAGGEGAQAALTRAWVEAVIAAIGEAAPPVAFQDERLSSHVAETRLGPMRRGRSGGPPTKSQRDAYRSRVDREAAAIILQDALDTRRDAQASMTRPQTSMETPA
ncbi:MAG TPA: Holliday junction resolvase RuvX [Candidatus Saccharimonadales bacterium]|nr:Holliday junction resolvase RuvX [Candidatus Saccharimonadales bacterium]